MGTGFSYDELEQKIATLEQEIAALKGRFQLKASAPGTNLTGETVPEEITFDDIFEVEEIQRIQDAFAQATGIASIITRPDGAGVSLNPLPRGLVISICCSRATWINPATPLTVSRRRVKGSLS